MQSRDPMLNGIQRFVLPCHTHVPKQSEGLQQNDDKQMTPEDSSLIGQQS